MFTFVYYCCWVVVFANKSAKDQIKFLVLKNCILPFMFIVLFINNFLHKLCLYFYNIFLKDIENNFLHKLCLYFYNIFLKDIENNLFYLKIYFVYQKALIWTFHTHTLGVLLHFFEFQKLQIFKFIYMPLKLDHKKNFLFTTFLDSATISLIGRAIGWFQAFFSYPFIKK